MKKALFEVGDSIEYIGERLSTTEHEGKQVPVNKKGLRWEVIAKYPPTKGYGFIKNDEDGEPIIDHDRDGHNLIKNEYGYQRLLWPEYKSEWKKVN